MTSCSDGVWKLGWGVLGNGGELGNTGVRGQRGSVGAWFCPSTGGFALAPEVLPWHLYISLSSFVD
jgi:hypothetical protein